MGLEKQLGLQIAIIAIFYFIYTESVKNNVKIVNSTSVKELRAQLPPKDQSGSVTYVYPSTGKSTDASPTKGNMTKFCVYRVEEKDHMLVAYNKTKEELAKEGKVIFDRICEGDIDKFGDKISAGALASLCCG